MSENEWLAEQFESNRARLRAVAYRLLGSPEEADDAVQETWLRLDRNGATGLENIGAWLTTVVSRICLDVLRSRRSRREVPLEERLSEPAATAPGPESEAVIAEAIGPALLIVLEALPPAERVAFVLHDMFGVPYREISAILARSPAAARKLASRARRRVKGAPTAADTSRLEEVVAAFLAAARRGDFQALVALLDPDAVLRFDAAAVATGAPSEVRGAASVAEVLASERASGIRGGQLAIVDGAPAVAWAPGGHPRGVFVFQFDRGTIASIDLIANPEHLSALSLELRGS